MFFLKFGDWYVEIKLEVKIERGIIEWLFFISLNFKIKIGIFFYSRINN